MALHTWLLYLLTCCAIALAPGPNALLALTHGALYGRRRALFTIGGGVLGFILMISLCALGLGALVQTSVTAFTVLKVAGGLYLVWLGIRLWRAEPMALVLDTQSQASGSALFRQGLLSAMANPKALLLFTAFIPPFMDPQRSLVVQTAVIALTYAAVEFAVEFGIASAAHRVRPWLARVGGRFNQLCGGLFVVLGVALPLRS